MTTGQMIAVAAIAVLLVGASANAAEPWARQPATPGPLIDAHAHVSNDSPECLAILEALDLKVLNVCVAEVPAKWRGQADRFKRLAREHPGRFAWCTSFDPPRGDDPKYAEKAIRALDEDFAAGAVACKIWRNFGLEIKDSAGKHVMVDSPLLEPILSHLERTGRTVLMHIGEPRTGWLPLEGNPIRDFYVKNPELFYHARPVPSYDALMAARDRVLERHPKLKVVGAHLGSMEHDVAELARRFDRYPNFAVDTSARLDYLCRQDREKVRKFVLDYQDRILFGSDASGGEWAPEKLKQVCQRAWDYFASSGTVSVHGEKHQALNLPADVLEKLFSTNAQRWYPALRAK